MLERRQIVALWNKDLACGQETGVLVTLVAAEGSSYRRPGARLLTSAAASGYAGTISGGCLEADVVRKAPWLARDHAVVERYAMSFDDTSDIPFGLGCGGTVDLLFEPIRSAEGNALLHAFQSALAGRSSTVVSFLPGAGRTLRRVIFDAAGDVLFQSPVLSPEKVACARTLEPGRVYEGRFVERLEPPQRLFIFGAGEDARPLVEMASMLGWSVIVADGRTHLANPSRFPRAERVAGLAPEAASTLDIGPRDAVVLMTHSYEQDREWLIRTLPVMPAYLGLLGSRHRSSVLVSEAAARLGWTLQACCNRIFAPVGMNLGGDGPEAIALAIVAEVQAVTQGTIASERRLTLGEVQQQIERGGASAYLRAQCALQAP